MTRLSRVSGAAAPSGDDRLRGACHQVEGLFIAQLLAEMGRPAWGEGILGGSAESRMFAAQRNRGLADLIYRQLSRSTAGATIQPAPAERLDPVTEGDAD